MRHLSIRRLIVGASTSALLGLPCTGYTQQSQINMDQATDTASIAVEEITVTGSRIRGVPQVGSNVVSVGNANLTMNTAVNVADILKQVPQVAKVGVDESRVAVQGVNTGNLARSSAINLRGVTPVATLVLLDDHRMVASSAGGIYVDPSTIPTIALERIEVVPDGASAIYGSDAIAGVVNMILRKDFTGAETRVRYGAADGYDRVNVEQLLGLSWDGGGATLAYEHVETGRLQGLERDFYVSDLRHKGGRDYRTANCDPGNILISGTYYALPDMAPGTRNRCEVNSIADILPEQRKNSVVATFAQDLGDRAELYAEGYWSRREFHANNAPITTVLNVPSSNAFYISPPGVPAPSSQTVEFNYLQDFGPQITEGFTRVGYGVAGVRFELAGNWRADVSVSYGESKEYIDRDAVDNAAVAAALASSDPATALNPFGVGPRTNPAVIANIFNGLFNPNFLNESTGFEFRADGGLFSLPGGDVRLAVGAEYRELEMFVDTVRGTRASPLHTVVEGERDVRSAYAELFIPIFGNANAIPGFQTLSLSLAGRVDRYNDVGQTENPKIGLSWSPVAGLTFRGSYGTSFRAPTLSDQLNPGASVTAQDLPDPLSPTGTSTGLSYSLFEAPLEPETAETYSIGVEWKPESLPGLSLGTTYFSLDYDKQVVQLGTTILQQENLYAAQITRNPTPEQVQALLNSGLPVSGAVPAVVNYIINITPANLGRTRVQGFDVIGGYRFDAGSASIDVGADATYYTNYESQVTPAASFIDRRNFINYPTKFRARAYANAQFGSWTTGLTVNHFNSYQNDLVTPVQKIDSWTTLDANLYYTFEQGMLNGLTVGLDASNLLDEDPPFADVIGGYDPGGASALGRMVSLSVTMKW